MNYKAFIQIISALFFTFGFSQVIMPVQAANPPCATIQKIEYTNIAPIQGGNSFICNVTVGAAFAGSGSIACGLSINGAFPSNTCPSNTNFLGWQGNVGSYDCKEFAKATDRTQLVAYDFGPGCGVQTGIKAAVSFPIPTGRAGATQTPGGATTDPQQTPITGDTGSTSGGTTGGNTGGTSGEALDRTSSGTSGGTNKPATKNAAPVGPNGIGQGVVQLIPSPQDTTPLQANQNFSTMREVFESIGCAVGVPPRVLERVALTEYSTVFDTNKYTPEVIRSSTKPGGRMPNCPNNYCAAIGVMQMTIDTDVYGGSCNSCLHDSSKRCCYQDHSATCANQWAQYGDAVNDYIKQSNYTPDPCNIRDNIYAAAVKLKHDSGFKGEVCGPSAKKWSYDQVFAAGYHYYGRCVTNEGLPYCQKMWDYYNK